MNRPFAFTVLCTIALATALSPSRAEANQSCEGLAKLSLKNVTITSAVSVAASATLPAHCRVFGIATPTIDSAITFEVLLPAAWNGKYLQAGNGGYGGSLGTPMGNMLAALQRGYAAAGTDMGHSASDPVWAFGHPERVADWGYRANHVTAQTAKAIVKAFYGEGPELSYFSGCSDGGHEALMEAQRFPEEFDGIIAGAPANFWTHQSTAWIWEGAAALSDPASALSSDKLKLVTSAAVAACDGIDGLNDGLPVRSGEPALRRRRSCEVPHRPAGRGGQEDLCRSPEPAHGCADLSRPGAGQRIRRDRQRHIVGPGRKLVAAGVGARAVPG